MEGKTGDHWEWNTPMYTYLVVHILFGIEIFKKLQYDNLYIIQIASQNFTDLNIKL